MRIAFRLPRLLSAAAVLACLSSTAWAQSQPPLQIGQAHDPGATVIRGDSEPAVPIHADITQGRSGHTPSVAAEPAYPDTTVVRPGSQPALPINRSQTVHAGSVYSGGSHFTCESTGNRFRRCGAPHGYIRLDRQLSRASCIEGRDWGVESGSVWVSNGCRASFRAD